MKTKKKEKVEPRMTARSEFITKFMIRMNSIVVIDGMFRNFITQKYLNTIERLAKEKWTTKKWMDVDRDFLYREYKEIEEQVKMLRIFSENFMYDSGINSAWHNMLDTFNPNQYLKK